MSNRNKDELSDLLDSFQADDTMERKMNDFARQKEHKSRVQRAQEHESVRIQPETPRVRITKEDTDQGETVVFNKVNVKPEETATEGTVMMDDKEIKSLLDENKGPQLRVEKDQRVVNQTPRRKKKPKTDPKKIGAVVACVVGALLVTIVLFGVIKAVVNGFGDSEKKQQENYDRIVEFLEEEDWDLSRVRKFKELYDKLSDEMKEEINDEIYTITNGACLNFDDLLDKAKEEKRKEDKEKKDQKNENTKIAERKAEIKDEISKLKKRLRDLEREPDNSKELAKAEKALRAAEKKYNDAQADVNEAQEIYNNIGALINTQAQIDALESKEWNDLTDLEKESLPGLYDQVRNLKASIPNLGSDWNKAYQDSQNKVTSAQAVADERAGVLNQAQADYDAIASEAPSTDNEAEKQRIQAQIDELEQELRELDRK